MVGVCVAPVLAGVVPAVDNLVCRKVKDLKNPGAIVPSPNPTSIFTYFTTNSCELGKLMQICTPSKSANRATWASYATSDRFLACK